METLKKGTVLGMLFIFSSCISGRYVLDKKDGSEQIVREKIREMSSRGEISRKPLVVLDGIPWRFSEELKRNRLPIAGLEIADIHVLETASASQIYGDQASAGVLMISRKVYRNNFVVPTNNVLILLDTRRISQEEMQRIDVSSIESIEVIKEREKIQLYTTEPVEGVIVIHTRGAK